MSFVAMGAYGAYYFGKAAAQAKRLKQAHLIVLVFAFAYALQTFAVLCEFLHLRRFAHDGKGLRWRHTWFALDFLSGVLQSISELVISLMLIALAFGWTLGLGSQEPLEGYLGRLLAGLQRPGQLRKGTRSPSALLLCGLGTFMLYLQAKGRGYEEDFNNFHDFEHTPGLILIVIRLCLCALFYWALRRSFRVEQQKEVLSFLSALRLAGLLWFLCMPLLVLLAFALPPYRRHQVVSGGSILLQGAALAMLSTLFMERSEYYKISSLAHLGSVFDNGFSPMRGATKLAVD